MAFFDKSTNIEEIQLDEIFNKKKDSEIDLVLRTLSIIFYQNATNTDIVNLYRLFGPKDLSKLILLLDGRPIKLPSANEFKEELTLSLVYYYREIKHLSWEQVKKKFPFEISGISLGIRIKQLNNFIKQHIDSYLNQMGKETGSEEKE